MNANLRKLVVPLSLALAALCAAAVIWLPGLLTAGGPPPAAGAVADEDPGGGGRDSGSPRPGPGSGDNPSQAPGSGAAGYLLKRKLTPAQEELVKRLGSAKVPLRRRRAEIEELAARGDEDAARVLMAAGSARIYVNRYAVESLGNLKTRDPRLREAARDYLRGRLTCADAVVVCAAVRALGRLGGEAAVPELIEIIGKNRERPDGHHDMVWTSVVEALGRIGSARAVPALAAELRRPAGNGWTLEYASSVLAALDRIGTPQARAAAGAYADRLEKSMPAEPMARTYYQRKIAEARGVAAGGKPRREKRD
jgi:HEAT repeat protein